MSCQYFDLLLSRPAEEVKEELWKRMQISINTKTKNPSLTLSSRVIGKLLFEVNGEYAS